jgi:phosphoserine phosphatase
MWIFFAAVAGWPRVVSAFLESLVLFTFEHFVWKTDRVRIDRGTFFKVQMLQRLIAGRRVASLSEPIAKLVRTALWNEKICDLLREHYGKGHHVVIASGSLSLYLPEMVKNLPHHALLCTDVGISDGIVIGDMPLGNCVRQGKAERVATYMNEHGPFGESWGYGNFPDDVPMMNLMKYRVIV